MNKVIGWFLIVFCSIILFVFGLSILFILFDFPEPTTNSNSEKITVLFGGSFFILFLIWGLRYGRKTIKKETSITVIEYNKVLDISLKGRIEFKAYRNLMLMLTFKRTLFFWMFLILILSVIPLFSNSPEVTSLHYSYAIFMVLLGVLMPMSVFLKIKKTYNTSIIFKEVLAYHLTNASIQIIGDTMNSTQQWTHFIKIQETQHFFLFYPGSQVVTLVEKRLFSEDELREFSMFLKSLNIPRE